MNWIRGFANMFLLLHLKNQTYRVLEPGRNSGLVSIIFSGDHLTDQQIALDFANRLQDQMSVRVYLFGFLNKKLDQKVTFSFPHISLSDMGVSPIPKSKALDLFLQRRYDYLINLDLSNHLVLHYLSNKIHARHKLAINPKLPRLYDIVLQKAIGDSDSDHVEKTLDIFKKTYG
ncbi:MAG: hypothetical protein OEQ53_05725 [Saprospiraceae bacterium]|nr:hypothetical protein [Saprospiraceae bacterium]